jgi:F0F1-type ATP synthase assembly protein I
MIKNLLNADEDPPPGTKVIIEDSIVNPPAPVRNNEASATEENAASSETNQTSAVPAPAGIFAAPPENEPRPADNAPESFTNAFAESLDDEPENLEPASSAGAEDAPLDEDAESLAALMAELENLEPEDLKALAAENAESENVIPPTAEIENAPLAEPVVARGATENQAEKTAAGLPSGTLFQSEVKPQSTAETIRQSGLAYSAAIVLFGSVVFMMIFGWFADLLLGSAPWGVVGGIILGGIIGFIQFFRITSQIFKK